MHVDKSGSDGVERFAVDSDHSHYSSHDSGKDSRGGLPRLEPWDTSPTSVCEVDAEDQRKFLEWCKRLDIREDDLKVFLRAGFRYEKVPLKNTAHRRALLGYLKRAANGAAKWVLVSGLYPEVRYSEPERRKRLRALYRTVVLLIKRSLLYQAQHQIAERTIYWDPIAEVCRELEIAPSKLSGLCKELTGNSLSQVIDCVRAERIKKLIKVQVRKFVRESRTHGATLGADSAGNKVDGWEVWKALKASRKWPAFCLNSWAVSLGFASYRRMYRACLALWKQTPYQVELEMLEECMGEAGEVETVVEEETIEGIQGLIEGVEVYRDEG